MSSPDSIKLSQAIEQSTIDTYKYHIISAVIIVVIILTIWCVCSKKSEMFTLTEMAKSIDMLIKAIYEKQRKLFGSGKK
jgi:hypothetical protein